jgi:hypothetical protein
MDNVVFEFNESAFKHGISQDSILYAVRIKIYDAPLLDFENKFVVIGFDLAGNPIEVMYNVIDDNTINIFHAMKARKTFVVALGL